MSEAPRSLKQARRQRIWRDFKRRLAGRELVSRIGHYCVGGRCKTALVMEQYQDQVDLRVIGKEGARIEQQRVSVLKSRSEERSFHLLDHCDKVKLVNGAYVDV